MWVIINFSATAWSKEKGKHAGWLLPARGCPALWIIPPALNSSDLVESPSAYNGKICGLPRESFPIRSDLCTEYKPFYHGGDLWLGKARLAAKNTKGTKTNSRNTLCPLCSLWQPFLRRIRRRRIRSESYEWRSLGEVEEPKLFNRGGTCVQGRGGSYRFGLFPIVFPRAAKNGVPHPRVRPRIRSSARKSPSAPGSAGTLPAGTNSTSSARPASRLPRRIPCRMSRA